MEHAAGPARSAMGPVNSVVHETPPSPVVFVRSLFYGIGSGGVTGGTIGTVASLPGWDSLLVGMGFAGLGALVGGTAGLILGVVVLVAGSRLTLGLRILVSALAMALVFGAIWVVAGTIPTSPWLLVFILPAGLAAWLLLPAVVRTEARAPMSRLRRQSN